MKRERRGEKVFFEHCAWALAGRGGRCGYMRTGTWERESKVVVAGSMSGRLRARWEVRSKKVSAASSASNNKPFLRAPIRVQYACSVPSTPPYLSPLASPAPHHVRHHRRAFQPPVCNPPRRVFNKRLRVPDGRGRRLGCHPPSLPQEEEAGFGDGESGVAHHASRTGMM